MTGNRAARIHRQGIVAVPAGDIAGDVGIIHQHHGVIACAGRNIAVNVGTVLQRDGGIAAVLAGIQIAINGAVIHQKGIGGVTAQRNSAVHNAVIGERQVGLAFFVNDTDITGHGAVIQRQRILSGTVHGHGQVAKGIDVDILERFVLAQLFYDGIEILRHLAVGRIHGSVGQGKGGI